MPTILALDIGSSSIKGRLADGHGGTGRYAHKPIPVRGTLIAPDDLTAVVREVATDLLNGAEKPSRVVFTGQMGSHVWIDEHGRATGDVLPWSDPNDAANQAELCAELDPQDFYRTTGQRIPGLAIRCAWGRATGRAGVPVPLRQWLIHVATGTWAIDPSDASVTGCLDVRARTWSRRLARRLEIPAPSLLPLSEPRRVVDAVSPAGAKLLAIPPGTPVITGAGDGPCASMGAGATTPAIGCLTLGSSATLRFITPVPVLDPDRRSTALAFTADDYVLSIPVSNAGFALEWARDTLGFSTLQELDAAAAKGRFDPNLVVLPYVTGERFPYWTRALRATIHGTRDHHDRADLARAVLTGVACTLRRTIQHARALGHDPHTVMVNGGSVASRTLLEITAALFDTELRTCTEETLTGAAILAGAQTPAPPGRPVHPDPTLAADRGLAEALYANFIRFSDLAARERPSR